MENKDHYLILDAEQPLVCTDKIIDEMKLYNIAVSKIEPLLRDFARITGKEPDTDTKLNTLSGGQKVILMVLLALYSPAQALCFRDLYHSLDMENRSKIQDLLLASDKEIIYEDSV